MNGDRKQVDDVRALRSLLVMRGDTMGIQLLAQIEAEHQRLQDIVDKLSKVWQPMDSAPRDGTEVLLQVEWRAGIPGKHLAGHYMPGGHCIEDHPAIDEGWYFWTGGMFDLASRPIAWMPIPAAAEAAREEG